jgi:hypothetical protein
VRRALLLRFALRAAAASIAFVTVAVVLGMLLPVSPPTAWARLALILLATGVAAWLAAGAFGRRAPGYDGYLEQIEDKFPNVRSWLRNALDFEREAPAHGSPELSRAVLAQTAARLEAVPLARMTPPIEPRRPAFGIAGAFVALVLLALASPLRVERSWRTLWNPALASPPVRLAVEPGDVKVTPGAALAVRAKVWGSASRPALEREAEGAPSPTLEGESEGARVWRFDLVQLTREEDYRVRVAHVESPRYRITLAGEPHPLSFTFEYRSPAYARLPVQRGASTRGDVSALLGTVAVIEATFDRDLTSLEASIPDRDAAPWKAVTPRRWRGEVRVTGDTHYDLHARAASGEASYRYRVSAGDDAPPLLSVIVPEGDVDLPTGQQIPLEVVGQDDLGLSELRLQFRKGDDAEWTSLTLSRFPEEPREARVTTRWDASPLGLLPGETASFRVELFDANAVTGRGRAVSPVYELRFPSMAELYDEIDRQQESVQKTLEKVEDRATELQESFDKLARQQVQPQARATPSFERAEEMKQTLERQQELAKEIDEATESLRESLEDAAERQAFDEELTRKFRELAELMSQIQSAELREAMRRMQQAIENLDQASLERSLQQMQRENKEMLQQLDRSIELLKRLREEERLESLARRAEELRDQQNSLNQAEPENPKENGEKADDRLARRQDEAAERTEQLSEDVRELAQQMDAEAEQQDLEETAGDLEKQAAPSQREAAEQTRRSQRSEAKRSGQKASEDLDRASARLDRIVEERRKQREGVDLAAVRRAAQDLVSLQRESEHNLESGPGPEGRADRQTDLAEGVARVADSLYTLAQRTPFITPKLGESLGKAMSNLQDSGRQMAQGNRNSGESLGRAGAQSLNEAILELRRTEDSMCQNSGQPGGEKSQSTPQQLGEIGERQSQLNKESRSMAQRLTEQLALSAGDREELERLAERQRLIRERLEGIQRQDEEEQKVLGKLDQAAREMEEVEEAIRHGENLGGLEEKQQRILSRLLDAQRSVHRRDFDPERESRTADQVLQPSPPAIPEELLKQSDRLRLDMLKAEADRYPAQYRAFIEEYLRSLNGSRR